ncbi:MAG TPA: PQQ-binding-like beta-propeller repeat protein [Polyangiaceae bacterium]|nr:PQQ-binding-like beta-propeller repeat protein [Polyangiaceae bacterium]
MTAIDVVVRPQAAPPLPEALAPLNGLFDLFVDGINLTARLTEAPQAALLVELAHALSQLNRGKRARACFPLYSDEEAWEIGLEADGVDALLSVYRVGPSPRVAIFDRRVPLSSLTSAVARALEQADVQNASAAMAPARRALGLPYPTYAHAPLQRQQLSIAPKAAAHVAFSALVQLKQRKTVSVDAPGLERADLHSLLASGSLSLAVKGRVLELPSVQLFLMSERLLTIAEDVLDAWRSERAVFRRAELDGSQLSVRRGPGDGPLRVSLSGPATSPDHEGTTLAEVPARGFVLACARFALSLAEALERADPSQSKNLRLRALARSARIIVDTVSETQADDSLQNPEPESYKSFGLPRSATGRGAWEHGGKMRFVPRWVATVPSIDLRATFQCGDKMIVGSQRETACLLRDSGRVLWRVAASRAASVVTPFGLARLGFDGRVELHDLETGGVRFTTHIAPRAAGGATGALVNGPALPKLLVIAEGDRAVTAVDLISGEVRWRFTGRRPASYRMRRAGKLLIVAGGDSALVALDVFTGEVVWRVRDRLPFSGDVCIDHDSAFAVAGGPVGPCKLLHVDLWTGALRWARELDERPCAGQAPLVSGNTVVIPTRDKRGVGVGALARDTGAPLWEQPPGLASPTTAWLVVDDALIANTASGALMCLEATTGLPRYSHVFSRHVEADQPRRLEPVLRNGALFVPQHQVHVIRPRDGEVLGTLPSDLIPDLLRVDERCGAYVAEESGHLAAFSVAPRLSLVK